MLTFVSLKRFQLSCILLIVSFSFLTQQKTSDSFVVKSFLIGFGNNILNKTFLVSHNVGILV